MYISSRDGREKTILTFHVRCNKSRYDVCNNTVFRIFYKTRLFERCDNIRLFEQDSKEHEFIES